MKKLIYKKIIYDINVFFIIAIICVTAVIWVIQAVNFLDVISEDGHSFKVYFFYTVFNLPKIVSKILPFIFFITLINILIKYETNNELIIYWLLGINKINFINTIIKLSFLYFFLQIFFTSFLVPYSLDKARSFFRSSNVDLFTSIIKEKKFIDTVSGLTIFIEKKDGNDLEKIILKDRISYNESQIIVATKGKIVDNNFNKSLILFNGKIINYSNNNQKIIDFSEFKFDLSKYTTNTITHPKIQESNSKILISCLMQLRNASIISNPLNCQVGMNDIIEEELFKRFYSPLYIILIALISSLIIQRSKYSKKYFLFNTLIFLLGVLCIILSDVLLKYTSINRFGSLIYLGFPSALFVSIYLYLMISFKKTT
tara:strand:+ start:590 stop:1702 length:1113 start_codon:yes stop_codon:yes gene_type:complete